MVTYHMSESRTIPQPDRPGRVGYTPTWHWLFGMDGTLALLV